MTGALFLPQANLDQWLDEGHVDMGQDALIFTADRTEFPLVPAVRFKAVVDGGDAKGLIGKVKAVEALRMGGAEVDVGAVVLGESAYEVEDGFMVTVQLPDRAPKAAAAKPKGGQEADLLAQFILNKLS